MLEGFVFGLVFWVGPAVLAWLLIGPFHIGRRRN